jgi:hypothetical protein
MTKSYRVQVRTRAGHGEPAGRGRRRGLAWALLAGLLAVTGSVHGQSFACPELQAVVAAAERDFAPLKGAALPASAAQGAAEAERLAAARAGLQYRRTVYAATRRLTGADGGCRIVETVLEDGASRTRQVAYECRDGAARGSRIAPAAAKQLRACVGGELDPDSDDESLAIYLDRVESGEGVRSLSVELDADAADGARLAVRKFVCLRKSASGCDDE